MFYLCTESGRSRVTEFSFRSDGSYTFIMDGSRLPVLFDDEAAAQGARLLLNLVYHRSDIIVKSAIKVPVMGVRLSADA